MKKLEQVSDIINKCVSYIGMVIFIVLIVACVAQVFFRFILNNSLSWSEELARYCFIWMHMLGASLLIEGSGHATVTAILDLMHGTLRKIVDIIIELVIFFDGTVRLYAGLKLGVQLQNQLEHRAFCPDVVYQFLRGSRRNPSDVPGICSDCDDRISDREKGG